MLKSKKCTNCHKIKPLIDFYSDKKGKDGLAYYCKECIKIKAKKRYIDNPKRVNEINKKWKKNNPNRVKAWKKKRRSEHPEIVLERDRRWRIANPDKVILYRKKWIAKTRSTSKGKLQSNFRKSIWDSIRTAKAKRHWEDLVDYTLEELKRHLEKHFLPGMTWGNYGKNGWHLDHVIPVSVFNFKKPEDIDFKRCWALKNLRPLWAEDNLKKSNKLQKPFQPALTMNI